MELPNVSFANSGQKMALLLRSEQCLQIESTERPTALKNPGGEPVLAWSQPLSAVFPSCQ
jgi:hypothetical protein